MFRGLHKCFPHAKNEQNNCGLLFLPLFCIKLILLVKFYIYSKMCKIVFLYLMAYFSPLFFSSSRGMLPLENWVKLPTR